MSKQSITRTGARLELPRVAHLALIGTMILHAIDHTLQARGLGALTPQVLTGGTALLVVALATLPMTLRHHPRAPVAAAIVGWSTALGVSASHLAPYWSPFSDPYVDLSLGVYSWLMMLSEVAAAVAFGLLGLRALSTSSIGMTLRPTGRRHADRSSMNEPHLAAVEDGDGTPGPMSSPRASS